MSDADLFEDRVKLLFDTRLEELLEKINSEYPDPAYREEIIDKGADLIEQKKAFEEKLNALENDEYRKSHDRIMNTIKSEFQEARDLTDQEMYKKARAYNKKFTIWKETSKTMEDLDNQLLLDKKMKEKIDNFIGMVQSDIDGRQFDISGKSFLEGVLDKDAENAKLEKEKSELIDKHTRELTAKDREKSELIKEVSNLQFENYNLGDELSNYQIDLALREDKYKDLIQKYQNLKEYYQPTVNPNIYQRSVPPSDPFAPVSKKFGVKKPNYSTYGLGLDNLIYGFNSDKQDWEILSDDASKNILPDDIKWLETDQGWEETES